jgi:hypothetical protein
MPKKSFSAEQIVTLLRQIEVSMAQGKPTLVACRDAGHRRVPAGAWAYLGSNENEMTLSWHSQSAGSCCSASAAYPRRAAQARV